MKEGAHNGVWFSVRWIYDRDLSAILQLQEKEEGGLSAKELKDERGRKDVFGMALEIFDDRYEKIIGFAFYEHRAQHNQLTRFLIDSDYRRQGWGRKLAEVVISRLSPTGRDRLVADVRESNLTAQLFFRAMGLVATDVIRDYFSDSGESAFRMIYQLDLLMPSVD